MPSYVRGREQGRLLTDLEIIEAYSAGETADSIGLRAACAGVTVLEIVRRAGGEVRRPGAGAPRPRLISDSELVRRYRAGEAGPRLADAAGCTPGTVYRVLRQYGADVRPPPNMRGGRRKSRDDG